MDSNITIGGSMRSSFTEGMDAFRFLHIPFSPLLGHTPAGDALDDEFFISPRDYGSRQEYLRSYTFTRQAAEPLQEAAAPHKNKSLLRLKAAVWAVVACTNRLPREARVFKEKMVIKTSQCLSTGVHYLRMPMPQCLMAGA